MNILKVYPHPDLEAGSERTMNIAAAQLLRTGHGVYLLHGQEMAPASLSAYTDACAIPELFARSINIRRSEKLARRLEKKITQWGIDLIHIHHLPVIAHFESMAARRPIVASVHVPLCPNGARYLWKERRCCDRKIGLGCLTKGYVRYGCGRLGNGERWSLLGFAKSMAETAAIRRGLGRLPMTIANSRWLRDELISEGLPESRVEIIWPPIEAVRNFTEDKNGTPVIVFAGRLVDFKGVDHLIRASAIISQAHEIWILGHGPMKDRLEGLARELGIADRVRFLGHLAGAEMTRVRSLATLAVVPSLSPETFGLVGPEAMELGLPVVAYRVGGIPEWLDEGVTGFFASPGNTRELADAIVKLLADRPLLERMNLVCRERAKRFHVERHVERLSKLFERLVDQWKSKLRGKVTVGMVRWPMLGFTCSAWNVI